MGLLQPEYSSEITLQLTSSYTNNITQYRCVMQYRAGAGQFHYRALLGAQYGLRPCQYPSGASTITERSCQYALWAWKDLRKRQFCQVRAGKIAREQGGQLHPRWASSYNSCSQFPVPGSRRITKHGNRYILLKEGQYMCSPAARKPLQSKCSLRQVMNPFFKVL